MAFINHHASFQNSEILMVGVQECKGHIMSKVGKVHEVKQVLKFVQKMALTLNTGARIPQLGLGYAH